MSATRRSLLTGGAAAGVGLAVAGAVPALAEAKPARPGTPGRKRAREPFPPLVDDPKGILALAEGFAYAIVTSAGETTLKTGEKTPSNHDGMMVLGGRRGRYTLIQNHEIEPGEGVPVPLVEGTVYDPGCLLYTSPSPRD